MGGKEEVESAAGVDRERARAGGYGCANDGLYGEAGELLSVGIVAIILFGAEAYLGCDVGAGAVGVEANGAPPAGNGGLGGGGGGGDRADEGTYDSFLSGGPSAVPNRVDGDVGGEDRAHVVLEVDKLRRAFVLL
ncbi:hypothetical protein HPP92_014281 [Vanilla planifolia]|uniref:Uncharacterized protein n=1 Tax=Vanilla planifolia TaxID=51239 RepID=A0A835URB3_VANPL|nr:hypothetical protein HPP92_014666 [Vanilla planifolia]KAG0474595.1 hypothetical protein HPP92_014281 [Vanilla planifolia]